MATYYPYARNKGAYLSVAALALSNQFESNEALDAFYEAIPKDEQKNMFLRASSTYYYMVKQGDWVVDARDCNPVIDYFTNTYKAVGLFAIIESLSDESHQDFFQWLSEKAKEALPIADKQTLAALHSQYKATYGSIRRCVAFFGRLSSSRQEELCRAVEINRKPIKNIKALSQYLYEIRSKFVHEADLVLQLSGPMHHFLPDKYVHTNLTLPTLFSAFEEGLVAYFRSKSP
jgi:hypothetical protein